MQSRKIFHQRCQDGVWVKVNDISEAYRYRRQSKKILNNIHKRIYRKWVVSIMLNNEKKSTKILSIMEKLTIFNVYLPSSSNSNEENNRDQC